jgi:hypothetical protein
MCDRRAVCNQRKGRFGDLQFLRRRRVERLSTFDTIRRARPPPIVDECARTIDERR